MSETFLEWIGNEAKREGKLQYIQILLNARFKDKIFKNKHFYDVIQSISDIERADKVFDLILNAESFEQFIKQFAIILKQSKSELNKVQ
jgi:hypothetical protein